MYLFPNCPFKPFEDNIFPLGTNPVDKLTTTNTINTNNCDEAITENRNFVQKLKRLSGDFLLRLLCGSSAKINT
jgi:hypothetical protein